MNIAKSFKKTIEIIKKLLKNSNVYCQLHILNIVKYLINITGITDKCFINLSLRSCNLKLLRYFYEDLKLDSKIIIDDFYPILKYQTFNKYMRGKDFEKCINDMQLCKYIKGKIDKDTLDKFIDITQNDCILFGYK
jgi:hypothetical protein